MLCILVWLLQMTAEDAISETQHDWRLAWLSLGAPCYKLFRISSSPGSHMGKPSTSWKDCIFIKIMLTSRNLWLGEVKEFMCIWVSQNINTLYNIPMSWNTSELDFVLLKPGNISLLTPWQKFWSTVFVLSYKASSSSDFIGLSQMKVHVRMSFFFL